MLWERCFGRATDGIRQERYISINFKRAVQPTPLQKPPRNSLFFVGLQSGTVPSPSTAPETYSLRNKRGGRVLQNNNNNNNFISIAVYTKALYRFTI